MKIDIYEDELYPYFEFSAADRVSIKTVEIDTKTYARLRRGKKAFEAYQAELDSLKNRGNSSAGT